MKFDPVRHRRDTLVNLMRAQAKVGKEEKLRKIRGMKDGIFFEMWNGAKWVQLKMTTADVDSIIGELYGEYTH